MSLTEAQRAEVIDDELVRPKIPGLRLPTVGILKLARKFGIAVPGASKPSPEEEDRHNLALTWLLDERNSLDTIRQAAQLGPDFLASETLDTYEMNLDPAFHMRARIELALTGRAVAALVFQIEAKPAAAGRPPDLPSGKSWSPPG